MSEERSIRLPIEDSKENYLDGFWQWVCLLAVDDYDGALKALFWPKGTSFTPELLKKRVTTFYGGTKSWSVVIPNERLVSVVNKDAEFEFSADAKRRSGWFLAQIPLTNAPANPKRDDLPLMGLAVSFFVREHQGHYVMEFEIFHA